MAPKQIFPASIMGDSGVHASVLDHNFGAGDPYTLGVEEEYMLLDPVTFDLVQHIETVLEAAKSRPGEPRFAPELFQSLVEISTPVCRNATEVDHELRR